jgi:predicted O-methyltransferase YrrM
MSTRPARHEEAWAQALESWTAVDRYLEGLLVPADPVLEQALADSEKAGLPRIQVAPNQGKMLHLFARLVNARAILEIGTLGGYSTIWLARGLAAGGRLITLEMNPKHAEVARLNLARAGLADVVEIRLGPALETLPRLAAEGRGPFDLIFIDADKPSVPDYFEWSVKLARPGGLIIVDNVVREGAIVDPNGGADVQGMRRLMEMMSREPRVSATAIQTVGGKGQDGFAMAVVIS